MVPVGGRGRWRQRLPHQRTARHVHEAEGIRHDRGSLRKSAPSEGEAMGREGGGAGASDTPKRGGAGVRAAAGEVRKVVSHRGGSATWHLPLPAARGRRRQLWLATTLPQVWPEGGGERRGATTGS